MLMRPLRSHRLTLLAAGALLASPLLAGCGFDYQTDQVNTISAGINDRDGSVDVLGAAVVAGEDDLGLFVATLSNDDIDNPVTLDSLEPTADLEAIDSEPAIEIPAGGAVSLFQTGGIGVSGAFGAGDFVDVTLKFSNGQVTTLEVNVLPPCGAYSLDKLTELTLPAAPAGAETESTTETTTETETELETETETEVEGEEEAGASAYSCEPLPAVEHGGEHGGEEEGE